MARPPNLKDIPKHQSIDSDNIVFQRIYSHMQPTAKVTCPHCGAERWYPLGTLRQQVKRQNFNGQCKPCGQRESRAGYYQQQKRKNGGRRNVSTNGYVQIGPTYIEADDLPLFRAMQGSGGFVFEHRLAMAKHLGRPLHSYECVDHMDGNKTNNSLDNLRLYLRGKQQPGSCPGYGTYYHEWQLSERKIKELERLLSIS